MKILVIEDNAIELKLAHHVLSAAGHIVSGANAAVKAFALIKADRPQVILVDLVMPGMNGLSLVRKLKSDPAMRDIHIVAITGRSEEHSKEDALAAGCDAYVLKPINTRELSGQLTAIVESGPAHQPATAEKIA